MAEGKEMIWIRTLSGFVPENENAERFMKRVKPGECAKLQGSIPRNLKHHRFYWALINLVYENQDYYKTAYKLHTAIKLGIGHTEAIRTKEREWEIPLPTDFFSMPQEEFDGYFKRVIDFLVINFSAAQDKEALLNEVCEMTGIPLGAVIGRNA